MANMVNMMFLLLFLSVIFAFSISSEKVKKQRCKSDLDCRKGSRCKYGSCKECLNCSRLFRKGSSCVFDSAQCGDCLNGFSEVFDAKGSISKTCRKDNVVLPESQNDLAKKRVKLSWEIIGIAAVVFVIILVVFGKKKLIKIVRYLLSNVSCDIDFTTHMSSVSVICSDLVICSGASENLLALSSEPLDPSLAVNDEDKKLKNLDEVFIPPVVIEVGLQQSKVFAQPSAPYYVRNEEDLESVDTPDGVFNSSPAVENSYSAETNDVSNARNAGESSNGTQGSDETDHSVPQSSEGVVTASPEAPHSTEANHD